MCEYEVLLTPMTIRIRINVSYKKARKTATIQKNKLASILRYPTKATFKIPFKNNVLR